MPVALPRELYDEVLSHLSADSAALQNAALVCRPWTEPSQTALFASVSVTADYDDQRSEARPSNLLRSLQDSPRLAAYVRTLAITLRTIEGAPIFTDKANTIATIIPLLPRISTLSLDADHIDDQMIAVLSEMALNAQLSVIDLPYAVFSSFSDFTRILPRSLCLQSLKIGQLIIQDTTAPPLIEGPPVIHSLTLDRCVTALARLAAWMFACPITVHNFRLVDCGGQSPIVVAILHAIAPSVVKLDLDLMRGVPPTKIVFPDLRSVTYRLDTANITAPRSASEHTAFLTSFEAPNLEEVTLCFHQYHPHLTLMSIDFLSLRRIDEHLSDVAKFPNLRKLNVELWFPPQFTAAERDAFWKLSRIEDDLVPSFEHLFNLGRTRDSLEEHITTNLARKLAYTIPLPPLPATTPLGEQTDSLEANAFFLLLERALTHLVARGIWTASACDWAGAESLGGPRK
ncbi:hypothetical protein C8R46DRAFT_1352759 [Mycena filopes]|nr:hypothetical protein C8R46DRAFT_1352759 [Mycena filopes]